MPFVSVFDNGLANLGALYGNVGLNATANQNFHNQLAANADYRAQSAQDFQQQQAQDSGADSIYRTLIGDVTRRQLSSDRLDNAVTLKGMTIEEQNELEGLKDAARVGQIDQQGQQRLGYLKAKNDFTATQNQANRDSKEGMLYNGTLPEKYYADDQRTQLGYDHDAARAQIETEKEAARTDYRNARTAQQQQDAQDRYDRANQKSAIVAQITELRAQRQNALRALIANSKARMQRLSPEQIKSATAGFDEQINRAIAGMNQGGGGFPVTDLSGMTGDNFPAPAPQAAPMQAAPAPVQGNINPILTASQIGQQILNEMPGLSKEAFRVELKLRLSKNGIDPISVGIQ